MDKWEGRIERFYDGDIDDSVSTWSVCGDVVMRMVRYLDATASTVAVEWECKIHFGWNCIEGAVNA